MHVRVFCLVFVLACLTIMTATSAVAQEGHPLIGTWSGEWGPSRELQSPVLIVLEWNTTTLSGVINPGYPDEASIRVGTLDSTKWTVHLEADSKDERGNPVKVAHRRETGEYRFAQPNPDRNVDPRQHQG